MILCSKLLYVDALFFKDLYRITQIGTELAVNVSDQQLFGRALLFWQEITVITRLQSVHHVPDKALVPRVVKPPMTTTTTTVGTLRPQIVVSRTI